jgi:orotate phosphoribosyltransferase
MHRFQRDFLRFAIDIKALQFGRFRLKSGRESPYFFNAGRFDNGAALARLGRAYAAAVTAAGIEFDMLYGPAYKGIPLAAATAIALADHHGRDLPYAFNRKEVKDHGEGGLIVGHPLAGKVLIVDDVITAGTSVRESTAIIREAGAEPCAAVIALDRQETGPEGRSAVDEVRDRLGLPVISIVTMADVIAFLADDPDHRSTLAQVQQYRQQYGSR